MFTWAAIFLLIALVAGLFGFTNISGAAVGFAKAIFVIALILPALSLVSGGMGRRFH